MAHSIRLEKLYQIRLGNKNFSFFLFPTTLITDFYVGEAKNLEVDK